MAVLLTLWLETSKGTSGLGPGAKCGYHHAMARKASKGFWRALRFLGTVMVVLVAIPLILTPVYLVLDPVSVPMLERYVTGPDLKEIVAGEFRHSSDFGGRSVFGWELPPEPTKRRDN